MFPIVAFLLQKRSEVDVFDSDICALVLDILFTFDASSDMLSVMSQIREIVNVFNHIGAIRLHNRNPCVLVDNKI